jgi:energy-coupling factor transporter ATP-binding protein EcfA2
VLELKDVAYAYPGSPEVVRGVSLTLRKGGRLGVIGENGSGKTTLARLMCGLLKPGAGQVLVDGMSTADPDVIHEIRRRAGIVFQDPDGQLVETTVEREIGFGLRNLGMEQSEIRTRVNRALEVFDIGRLRRRSCHLLSAGEKQTVTVASIFAMEPRYVILDESTSLLDGGSRRKLLESVDRLLAETGAGLVFISMRLEDVWTCDRMAMLDRGRIEFEGDRHALSTRLEAGDIRPGGLASLLSGIEVAVPGFGKRIASTRTLSAESVYAAIRSLRGPGEGDVPWP